MHPLKRIRLDNGLSQSEVAQRAGLSEQTISNAENRTTQIRELTLWRIANALGIDDPEGLLTLWRAEEEQDAEDKKKTRLGGRV